MLKTVSGKLFTSNVQSVVKKYPIQQKTVLTAVMKRKSRNKTIIVTNL